MSRGGTPQLTFREGRLGPSLTARAGDGISRAQVAQRDLMRYYALLEAGMQEVARLGLSRGQVCAICDAMNGSTILYDHLVEQGAIDPRMHMGVELRDAAEYMGIAEKWGVAIDPLIARIGDLSVTGAYALLDAVERFWRSPERDTDEMLREVGLA